MATPNGLPSVAWFEWGTNTSYGNQTPPVAVGNSFNVAYTSSQITNLLPRVPYHYRLVVSNIFAVSVGFDQLFDQANVVAWGADYVGQTEVPPGLSNAVAIAGAYEHNLALRNNETVVAWGDDHFDQTNVPPGLNGVLAVAGGQYSSLALRNNGTVTAWGSSSFNVTTVPPGLNGVIMISGGTYASLALRNSGNIVAWGSSFSGVTNVPPTLNNVVEIASGSFHNLAIRNDGTVAAWGDDSSHQTEVPPIATNVVAVAGGNFHSLALRYDGTVVAWGDDSAHQTDVPAGLSNVVAITAGGFHSMALQNDGTVVAWGDDGSGQTSVPLGLSNVVAISSGYLHSLALAPTLPSANLTILDLTNGIPRTNSILSDTTVFYRVNVPTNVDFTTNSLLFSVVGSLNVWFTTNTPPTITNLNDFLLITNAVTGTSIVSTATSPQLIPGTTYYLGVQNTNNFAAAFGIGVDFHFVTNGTPPLTNTVPISTVTQTNMNGTNGFLLVWFAPTNDLFQVQWRPGLTGAWNTFTNIVGFHTFIDPTNSEFEFFDDGTQTGGFSPLRFYRLILLNSSPTNPPPPPSTNSIPISGVTQTNRNGTNGFLLVWFAPTNDLFQVQWRPGLTGAWNTFTNIVGVHTFINATNSEFEFFDDGTQTGGFEPAAVLSPLASCLNSSPTNPAATTTVDQLHSDFRSYADEQERHQWLPARLVCADQRPFPGPMASRPDRRVEHLHEHRGLPQLHRSDE